MKRQSAQERFLRTARPCKLGTIPHVVQLDGRCTLKVGHWVRVRVRDYGKWISVHVTRVDPDGYFMADL
jgi:hypothetical protein